MIIEGNTIYADPGKALLRKADIQVVGTSYTLGYLYYLKGELLPSPILEKPEDFDEITKEEYDVIMHPAYAELVEDIIRTKYSVSDELAIQRQRDTKPEEFEEYFAFCEESKKVAWEEVTHKNPFPEENEPNN